MKLSKLNFWSNNQKKISSIFEVYNLLFKLFFQIKQKTFQIILKNDFRVQKTLFILKIKKLAKEMKSLCIGGKINWNSELHSILNWTIGLAKAIFILTLFSLAFDMYKFEYHKTWEVERELVLFFPYHLIFISPFFLKTNAFRIRFFNQNIRKIQKFFHIQCFSPLFSSSLTEKCGMYLNVLYFEKQETSFQ